MDWQSTFHTWALSGFPSKTLEIGVEPQPHDLQVAQRVAREVHRGAKIAYERDGDHHLITVRFQPLDPDPPAFLERHRIALV